MSDEELQELNKIKDLDIIECYIKLLYKLNNEFHKKPNAEYYKSSSKYDYYIEKPFKKIYLDENDNYYYKDYYYNAVGAKNNGCPKSTTYSQYSLSFCLSLCKYSKSKIKKIIDDNIKADDNNE